MKANRFLRALPFALVLLVSPAQADQSSIVTPTSGPHTMAEYAGLANDALLALQSCNSGSTAPANGPSSAEVDYQCWADTSAAPAIAFKRWDGTQWVTFGVLDTSAHTWTPYRNGAPIVAVATSGDASDLTAGTLPAARLPNPSVSTLGGVQSKSCASSNWLNTISTSGVLGCSQPSFADLSGSISGTQLPAFSGDVSTSAGGTVTAIGATKVTSAMLNSDVFSTAHSWPGQQTFTAPALGTPASGVATNLTGTASGLTAGHVTTNANLTGDVTSVGNGTTITNAPVIAKVLTGFASGTGTVTSSDTILSAFQKLYGNDALKAPLASPALTGTPTAPTASPSDNSTKIATTAYVDAQVASGVAGVASLNGQTGALTLTVTKQVFTSSGTYTPTGMVYAIIECVGSGGGGGNANGTSGQMFVGAGGGSGSYSRVVVSAATVGASKTVTVGVAGTGGASGGTTGGTAGSDVSVGALCVGKGGGGGGYASSSNSSISAGAGGVAGTGDVTAVGAPGAAGIYATVVTVLVKGGAGGASYFGGGGAMVGFAAAGNAGSNYGAGGSGGNATNTASNFAGGNGSAGIVVITEFCLS